MPDPEHPGAILPALYCRGKWLHFMGDSSVRGLYLAFHQHIVRRFDHQQAGVMDMSLWNGGSQSYSAYGWVDVVLMEHAPQQWLEVAAHVGIGVSCPDPCTWGAWAEGRPAPDQSIHLHGHWCNKTSGGSTRERMRLTYQQLTRAKFVPALLSSMQEEWQRAPCGGPDAILLSLGPWDLANGTSKDQARPLLLESLRMLRNGHRNVVYASPTHPWEVGWTQHHWKAFDAKYRRDHYDWMRELVDEANAQSLAKSSVPPPISARPAEVVNGKGSFGQVQDARIRYFDRMIDPSALLPKPCVAPTAPSEPCHAWHPPHAVNVGLLPTLLHVWLGADGVHGINATGTADGTVGGRKLRLATRMRPEVQGRISSRGSAQCCCTRPNASAFGINLNTEQSRADWARGHPESTSYWANECP